MKMFKIIPTGEVSLVDVSKKTLAEEFNMHTRDFRPIFLPRRQLYTISIRGDGLIVNLGKIKLCIGNNSAYFVLLNDEKRDLAFSTHLTNKIKNKKLEDAHIPFEFMILEAAFEFVLSKVQKHFISFESRLARVLSQVSEFPTEENFEKLLLIKKEILSIEKVTQELQDTLTELLNDDEAIDELVLANKDFEEDDLESILDNILEQVIEISHDIYKEKENIDDTQEIVTMKMATIRNAVIQVDLLVSVSMLILAFGTLITGFFGMNLQNSFENYAFGFWFVVFAVVVLSVILGLLFWKFLKQKYIL